MKYNFTESVFDIIVLASCKALVLFIIITELEIATVQISLNHANHVLNINNNEENQNRSRRSDAETVSFNGDTEALVNQLSHSEDNNANACLKLIKRSLLIVILILNFFSLVYVTVKFSFILKLIVDNQKKLNTYLTILFNANLTPAMNFFFFSILVAQLGFELVEFIFACCSWKFLDRLSKQVLEQQFKSSTLTAAAEAQNKKPVSFARLLSLSYPERFLLMIGFLLLIISSVTNIAVPYFFGLVVDSAVKFTDLKEMNKYIIYMFLVFAFGSLAGGMRSLLFELAGERVVARLRKDIFSAIINKDIQFFDANRTGELTSRISSDTQVLQNAVTVNLSMLTRYILQIIGSIVFMLTLEVSLTGLLLAVVPVLSLLTVQYGRYLKNLSKIFQDELAAASIVAEETISSIRTVRSFAAEKRLEQEYNKNVTKSFEVGKKLAVAGGGFAVFVGLLSGGALALILWYGGKLVHDKKISTGLLASFLMYTLQVAMGCAFITSLYGDFMKALGASQRIFEILDSKPKIVLNKGFTPLNETDDECTFNGSLLFDNVSFSYPTRAESLVLNNVTLHVEKGKTLALVGPSGGGKSTMFALIERFYDSDSGEIKLGPSNTSLKAVNTNWLYSKVALVSQEPVLFGGSIKDNISFGIDSNEKIDISQIIEVAKLANAHEFITTFESGYDTIVGERGTRLSGGQKQSLGKNFFRFNFNF